MMRADGARIVWNGDHKRWEVHVQVGAEVVKRPLPPREVEESGEAALKQQAIAIARDEGYDLDVEHVAIEESPGHTA